MLTGRIELVEPLHPDIFVSVDIGGQTLLVRTGSDDRPVRWRQVGVSVAPGSLHVFDADGQRMDVLHAPGLAESN